MFLNQQMSKGQERKEHLANTWKFCSNRRIGSYRFLSNPSTPSESRSRAPTEKLDRAGTHPFRRKRRGRETWQREEERHGESADRSRERNRPGYLLRPKGSQWQGRLGVSLRRGGFGTSALGVLPATRSPRRPLSPSRRRRRRRRFHRGRRGRAQPRPPGPRDWRRRGRASAPKPSTINCTAPILRGGRGRVDGGEERRGRGRRRGRETRPGITTTVDAARYFWRQVDIGLTCVRSDCLPASHPASKGFSNVLARFSPPSASGSSTGGSSTLSRTFPPPPPERGEGKG